MANRIRISNWNAAALAGGVAIGVLGSRLLPPVMANASGSVRAKFGRDPFRALEQDHRLIEAALEQMAAAADESVAQRTKLFLLFKRKLGKHALAEEDVVYPVLHDVSGSKEKALELFEEHAQMKIHLYGLENALTSPVQWGERVQRLREVILPHIRDEEDVEFPRLRRILQEKQNAAIAGKILREEAMIL
jgi:hemerythrin superfamily protein